MTEQGKYIVIEGGDGCGKDTQLPLVVARLEAKGMRVHVAREPYDSVSWGDKIQDMLFARNGEPNFAELSPAEQAEWMNRARAEIVPEIARLVAEGTTVVTSRNWLSTMAYQGHEKGLSQDDMINLRHLCQQAAAAIRPDLVVLIDLPAEEGQARQTEKKKDVHELMGVDFHERVRQGYCEEARLIQWSDLFRLEVIAAAGVGIEEMTDLIMAKLEGILPF